MSNGKTFSQWIVAVLCFAFCAVAQSAERQMLHGHVPTAVARLTPRGQLDPGKQLTLAIGLPLQNQADLDKFLKELSDPASPNYRKYLTPVQFAERFGPSKENYETVVAFANAHGLTVTDRHPNRVIVDVRGTVSDIENALHVKMRTYQHPSDARDFYAPDAEPSVDLSVPVLHISGLDNYSIPHPNLHKKSADLGANATPNAGVGPSGAYAGGDFRAAYVPGTTLTGAGQAVGLLQFDGYYASDIAAYKTQFGLPDISVINVPVDGGVSTPGSGNSEVCLDIEMVMSMAPGISTIYVYEAPNPSPWVDLLSKMANDNLAKQLSCSWGGGSANATAEAIFQQMAAQGQTFFNATGDSDAFTGSISFPSDSPNITEVGATTLTTNGPGGSYVSETVWNWGDGTGSSGGISTYYSIPVWQQAVSMATNQGSTTMRNVPDVALVGDNVYVKYNNGGSGTFGGTSCAAPLWAAFTALVNQQAAACSRSPVGFLNPTIYALGTSGTFSSEFHDTTTGNNFSSSSPLKFCAVTGYDLCTGWGTPLGTALINALAGPPVPVVTTGSSLPPGTENTAYNYTLAVSGASPPYSWAVTAGALQAGLNLSGGGVISGTPTATGTANFTVQVTDTTGQFSTAAFSLAVYPQGTPIITNSSPLITGTAGFSYQAALVGIGGLAPYEWAISSGGLPLGLSLGADGVILGTPTTAGTSSFAVQITDANGLSSTAPFSITVVPAPPPPVIATGNPLPMGAAGIAYSQTLMASSGTPPYVWSLASGSLPPGLGLSDGGVISGTPTTTGTAHFTAQVTDCNSLSATKAFTLAVYPQGTLMNGSFETGDFTNWIISDLSIPFVPARVETNGFSPGYGLFSSVATDGVFSATHGFDGNGPGVIRIAQEISVSASAPFLAFDYRAGWDMQTYSGSTQPRTFCVTLQPSGGGSALLNAVQLTAAPGTKNLDTGRLSGVVDLSAFSGTTVRVCFDANIPESHTGPGLFELDNVRLLASVPPTITTSSPLPNGTTGSPYSQALSVTGGAAPYTWSIYSGSMIPGLTLSSAGVISGKPISTGTASFNVVVTDINGASATKAFTLTVTLPVLYSFPLDTDPNWTRQGQWAFGKPTGGGGTYCGYHDPTLGATGTNVFGVNLTGDYSTTAGGPYYLTAGPINFSNCSGVKMQFQRWLNTYYQPYVAATIDVSNNGTTWTSVYKNPTGSLVLDSQWTQLQYDISSVADKHSAVYVRWGYAILVTGPPPCSGWNIDDIQFLGSGPSVTPSIPASASEAAGVVGCGAMLSVSSTTAVTVSLVSSDPKTVTVPATVTIPAGQNGAGFPLTIINDSILNGPRNISITASAQGYVSQSKTIAIYDDETATLSVSLPSSIREGDPTATGTVTMSAPAGADVTVALSSSDPSRLAVGSAVIRAGQTSGVFSITAIDDNRIDGTEIVTVTAHVANWTDGSSTVNVIDNETTTLSLSVPATVREGDGTKIGSVQIPGILATDLTVFLASDNTGKIVVPATATIPAGQTSGSFGMTIVDNTVADGAQTATITATSPAFTSASASIVVADNELDHIVFSAIASPQIRNAPITASITAYATDNTVITNYAGTVTLSGSGSSGPVPITPTSAGNFVNGVWTGNITVGAFDGNVLLIADDGAGHTATSNGFAVGTGTLHHFGFGPVSSPQVAGTPFVITVFAQDIGNNTTTDFSGQISLSASSGSASSSNVEKLVSGSGSNTIYSAANRDFRVIASGSTPAYSAGTIHSGSGSQSYPLSPLAGGTISLPVAPSSTGNFVSGVWSGNVSVLQPGVAVALSGSDSLGHSGMSNTFDITTAANMSVTPAAGINSSGIVGGPFTPSDATYTISNNGTGLMDWTVSGTSSWLSFSPSGGTIASGSSATVTATINSAASMLPVGSTSDTIAFVNTTTGFGNTTRGAALTVLPPPPVITSPLTATGTNSAPFSYQIAATNTPTAYAASGLPSGLSVNTMTGGISGTPTVTGTSNVTISASNAGGTGSATLTLVLLPPSPVITSSLTASGICGAGFIYQITASNSPTSYGATGLPSGLIVSASNGLISGTPVTVGTSSITITASNAGGTGSATLALTVVAPSPPVITGTTTASAAFGSTLSYQITASNYPTSFRASGLPSWLQLNSSTGLISGTPTHVGCFNATITAVNMSGTGSATLTIDIPTLVAWGSNFDGEATVPAGLKNITAMAGGEDFSLALKSDGTVTGWGYYVGASVPSGLNNVVSIAAGGIIGLALKSDGTVVGWGDNIGTSMPADLNNVVAISGGFYHAIALKSDGTVVAWGNNCNGVTNVPADLKNVVAISAGGYHNLALLADGTVTAWGDNAYGQSTVPAGLNNVVAVSAGFFHSLALKSDGTVVAWGYNNDGETTVPSGLKNVVAISASVSYHSIALKSDGTIVSWGGDNSNDTIVPGGLNNVVAIDAGFDHSMALTGTETATASPLIISPSRALGAPYYPFQYRIVAKNNPTGYGATGLPSGLGVSASTGLITGTPTQSGTFNVILTGTNSSGPASSALVLTILPPPLPVITSSTTATGTSGIPFNYQITATNGPISYAASGLPTGLAVNTLTGLISGKPTQSGTFNATLGATNAGGTGSAPLLITLGSPFNDWRLKNFMPTELTNPNISGDMACPAGDGVSNLMKYALNLDPKRPASIGLPVCGSTPGSGGKFLTLTYTQVLSASDITYTAEVSGDLQTWNSGDAYTDVISVTNNADGVTQSVMVQDLNPATNSISRRFIRLKVTKP